MSHDKRQHEKEILLAIDKMNERDAMIAQDMMTRYYNSTVRQRISMSEVGKG